MTTRRWIREMPLHLMIAPAFVVLVVFGYIPIFGLLIAFQKFYPALGVFGSPWVGWDNFVFLFRLPSIWNVIENTVIIAALKLTIGILLPLTVSIMLNEVRIKLIRSGIQTLIYLPHFLSWVILSGILIDILSINGIVNSFLGWFGMEPTFFLGSNRWFRSVLVVSDAWKDFGFSTIVYLAAITSINPALYEAAIVDGATRWKQMTNVTIPGMMPIIVLMTTLSLGNILNAGFEQVFNLYNPSVYQTGDIVDTFIYRIGLVDFQYGLSTAVSMIKSVISCILIAISYFIAYHVANYRIF